MDRYAVIGNPISHSKSPFIHAVFARQTGQAMQYEALMPPLHAFRETVERFRTDGGRGLNVTVPFKLEAFSLARHRTPRAEAAGAVNTLLFDDRGICGDNTDGAGLVRDLTHRLGCRLDGARILLLGAGGAARGAVLPLLEMRPDSLVIANRTHAKADALVAGFCAQTQATRLSASTFAGLDGCRFDLVINATSASLAGQAPDVPRNLYAENALAYDMMYGPAETAFLRAARGDGASRLADGLGMLVEQAAESFLLWRGVRPETDAVLAALKARIASE